MNTTNENNISPTNVPQFRPHWLDLLLILIFCMAFLGYRLGPHVPLTDHEARVALTAQQALENGHWIVPHCNGQIRLQKPPLMYWVVAAAAIPFGHISEFVVRLPAAAAAAALAAMMYVLGGKMFDRAAGIITGLATAAAVGILYYSHRGTADILLTAFVVATMLAFYLATEAVRTGKKSTCCFLLAYLAFALANLAKGPVPVIAVAAPLLAYALWLGFHTATANTSPLRAAAKHLQSWQLHWGLVICLLIVGGWAAAVLTAVPDALFRWKEEYVARYLGQFGAERRWHYYLPRLFLLTLPWSVFLPVGLTLPFRKELAPRRRELMLLFLWLLVGLVLFSISKGKRVHYILPILPPAIMLATAGMSFTLRQFGSTRTIVVGTAITGAATLIGAAVAFPYLHPAYPQAMPAFYWLIGIVLALELLAAIVFLRWGELPMVTVFALGSGLCFTIIWPLVPVVAGPQRDPRRVVEQLNNRIGPDAEIYSIGETHPQLVYYYGKAMPQIPTDREAARILFNVRTKQARQRALVEIQELTVDRVFDLMARPGTRYFIIASDKLPTAKAYADVRHVTFHQILTAPKYVTNTKDLILLSNRQ